MSAPLWRLENVVVGGLVRPRLDAVSVEVVAGTTAVLGISGAGKTTLLNLLCGFARPHGGRVENLLPETNGRLSLFWVPQNDGLWPHRSVREHVAQVMPRCEAPAGQKLASGTRPRTPRRSVDEWLAAFDLSDHADKSPEQLSHGERNRLAVVRALASGAAVLVMDEPMAHVDPARINDYWKVIRDHCRETETSLIVATHSPEVALSEAEQAICLRGGRIVYSGPMHELYHSPRSPDEAALLGPANWFSPAEARHWLGDHGGRGTAVIVRKQLAITAAETGPYVVEEARFAGAFGEVALSDEQTGASRRFLSPAHGPRTENREPRRSPRDGDPLALLDRVGLRRARTARAQGERDPLLVDAAARAPRFPAPRSVTCGPHDEVYILDKGGRVLVFSETGTLLRKWDMPDSRIGNPEGACVFADGRIAVADTHYSRVVFFDHDGKLLGMLGSEGRGPSQFLYPVCVSQDGHGNFYVGEYGGNDRVQKFSVDGKFLLQIGRAGSGPGEFQRASGVVWRDGLLFIADAFNNRVQVFTDKGEFRSIIGLPESGVTLGFPYALALGPQNDLFVIEYMTARVSRFDLKDSRLLGRFGTPGRGEGEFSTPWGIDVNSKGTVLVADTDNRRVVELRR